MIFYITNEQAIETHKKTIEYIHSIDHPNIIYDKEKAIPVINSKIG